jgi:hypothetical protein
MKAEILGMGGLYGKVTEAVHNAHLHINPLTEEFHERANENNPGDHPAGNPFDLMRRW